MDTVLDKIAAWQAAGLIDGPTADRLRASEGAAATLIDGGSTRPTNVASAPSGFFGPQPTVVEMFGYLGGLFLIAAWSAFLIRIAVPSGTSSSNMILAAGAGLCAAVLLAIGIALRDGDARRRRAGGSAIVAATFVAAAAGTSLGLALLVDSRLIPVAGAAAALLVATIGRIALPAVTTQGALLLALTGFGWAVLNLLRPASPECCLAGEPEPAADVLRVVIVPAIGWLVVAVGLGFLGLQEARTPGAAAQRRAGLTQFWAGLVAVAGVSLSLFTTDSLGNGEYGRLVEPWIAEAAILVVSLVLVERAFRRDSSAFIFAAAIGLVTALTDFNFRYLTNSTDVGLFVEGLILIGAGFAADRLRRRIERSRGSSSAEAGPVEATAAEAPLPTA